ncbi:tom37 protein [Fusarium longipes]|uniref:Tom37 protein n=1 Tax=Fusarium longipes TaxID=694270 RepID=A0A395SUM7_9HYPO|nr:tom37 protein [Fusarium longipes]
MLDLHIWGSAFGLPSIDPECLAIITYLHSSNPTSAWRLIPSNDPSVSPSSMLAPSRCLTLPSLALSELCLSLTVSDTLPALHHEGVWISGFAPIVQYLADKSLGDNLDAGLTSLEQADRVAYAAFLSAHAAPLLDLSLYVSAANWAATTRPAFSTLLPFPLTWTVPPLLRAEAVKRVEHLGFADMDTDFDPNGGLHLSSGRDALPETFRRHIPARTKKTIHEEMTPEQAVLIRLYGITEDCLSVVDDFLKDDSEEETYGFFEGTKLSSLDCLAFGYLALMRDAPVPRSFLKDWLMKETPRLSKFVDDVKTRRLQRSDLLPWAESSQNTALRIGSRTLDSILHNVPGLGEEYATEVRKRAEGGITGVDSRSLMLALSLLATGAALGYSYHTYKAIQPFGSRIQVWQSHRDRSKLSEFGALGSMLGSVLGGRAEAPRPSYSSDQARFVETDTEIE